MVPRYNDDARTVRQALRAGQRFRLLAGLPSARMGSATGWLRAESGVVEVPNSADGHVLVSIITGAAVVTILPSTMSLKCQHIVGAPASVLCA